MALVLVIAISLSMDAFSLALAYGMYDFNKKDIMILSCIVGLYHLFMPLFGNLFGLVIFNFIKINPSIIVAFVFIIIGLEMIIEALKNEKKSKITNYIEMLGFGLAVSIDSFSAGIGIRAITNNLFFCFLTFAFVSATFTMMGLILGKKISQKIGKTSSIIGALILIIIGATYIFR